MRTQLKSTVIPMKAGDGAVPADLAAYIRDIAGELGHMAKEGRFDFLAYLLAMVADEAAARSEPSCR